MDKGELPKPTHFPITFGLKANIMVKFVDNLVIYISGVENRKQGLKYIRQIEMNLAICP